MTETRQEKTPATEYRQALERLKDGGVPPLAEVRGPAVRCECLNCGNCLAVCDVLTEEGGLPADGPAPALLKERVGERCRGCLACVLACPRLVTDFKRAVIHEELLDALPPAKTFSQFDRYLAALAGLLFGLFLGILIAW